ncbi:phosphohydrolase [Actinoplanes sp. NBRC 14428]|uniref:HD domain-containing protein n=1 Tax=Pseudosporangium ferrugineum TaxID=439699 RepID=A0A2T0RE01_9ACTN|nr:HD domain-containing protein [Pseudosporangium ferrugineum]PRY19361.1 HD domain-containing protein [Pseudosporangium ferrugineum]BCJ54776.1 phosphohydrolase [Actinoplanes sp. NBRC 14428]
MTTRGLDRALTESALLPLPAAAAELLVALGAPPRLGAHLRAVHDVAWSLTDRLGRLRPELRFDTTAVLFGAATHDIGKIEHAEELSGPGHRHEAAGRDLLLRYGVPIDLARFAGTHGSWTAPEAGLDDLLVSLADKIWKGARVVPLEERVAEHLGGAPWEAFLVLDDVLQELAGGADERLAFQASFPL